MALTIEDHGIGNRVEITREDHAALRGTIVFNGNGALVSIGPGAADTGIRLEIGTAAVILIGAGNHLGALFIHAAAAARVRLGNNLGLNGHVRLMLHEPAAITIGNNGLIADAVDLTVSDMHPIFDTTTGERINPPADIDIADRVWIGARSLILKGTRIGPGTIIGAGAIVTGLIPPNCIAAGNPARVVRTGVRWEMDLPQMQG